MAGGTISCQLPAGGAKTVVRGRVRRPEGPCPGARPRDPSRRDAAVSHDRPTALELIEAVTEFLAGEIAPALDDHRLRFRTLVALNALGIAHRELEHALRVGASDTVLQTPEESAPSGAAAPRGASNTVLQTSEELAELSAQIRAGAAPEDALELLKEHVAAKLRISNPRYLDRYE